MSTRQSTFSREMTILSKTGVERPPRRTQPSSGEVHRVNHTVVRRLSAPASATRQLEPSLVRAAGPSAEKPRSDLDHRRTAKTSRNLRAHKPAGTPIYNRAVHAYCKSLKPSPSVPRASVGHKALSSSASPCVRELTRRCC